MTFWNLSPYVPTDIFLSPSHTSKMPPNSANSWEPNAWDYRGNFHSNHHNTHCVIFWWTNIYLPQIGHWWPTESNDYTHVQLSGQQRHHLPQYEWLKGSRIMKNPGPWSWRLKSWSCLNNLQVAQLLLSNCYCSYNPGVLGGVSWILQLQELSKAGKLYLLPECYEPFALRQSFNSEKECTASPDRGLMSEVNQLYQQMCCWSEQEVSSSKSTYT